MADIQIPVGGEFNAHAHEYDTNGNLTTSNVSWQSMDTNVFTVGSVSADTQHAILTATGQAGYTGNLHLTADSNGFEKNLLVELIGAPVADITITQD